MLFERAAGELVFNLPARRYERRWARGTYRARTLAPEERQEVWPRLVAMYPAYED